MAEHGSFIKHPHQDWDRLILEPIEWKNHVHELFIKYHELNQGSMIEVKDCSITFHYRNSIDVSSNIISECKIIKDSYSYDFEVLLGKMNVEVKPKNINKGWFC